MHFHILGLGSIGSLLAHHLRRTLPSTHTITLIHKSEYQALAAVSKGSSIKIENNGLVSTATGFRSEVFEVPYTQPGSVSLQDRTPHSGVIESLFVTTKAHQTIRAIQRLLPRLTESGTIVLLQNGMGIYEELVGSIFRNPSRRPHFVLASNTHGAFMKGFYDVVHTGVGTIDFGIVPDPHGWDFEAGLRDDSIPVRDRKLRLSDIGPEEDNSDGSRYRSLRSTIAALQLTEPLNPTWKSIAQIQLAMRRKVVVNSVVNPLTAIMGCRNGDILASLACEKIIRRVCQEASDAFSAQIRAETQDWLESIDAEWHRDGEEKVKVGRIPPGLTQESLMAEVKRVATLTKGNISSMLSDIRFGRPTEVNYLNGYLILLGKTYRVPMPATTMLMNLVKMRSEIPLDQIL